MNSQVAAAIIAASVSFLTLIGSLAAQYFGHRATSRDLEEQGKRLDRTLAEQRTRTLNERFATAAGQLGSDKPPAVRLAGVYAMTGLADDWPENRQTCVDVLCGYLRMPYEPDPGQDAPEPERLAFQASREVRHTVIRVITPHLKEDAAVSWQGLNFDFTGVVFDSGDFRGVRFSGGTVSFDGAKFSSRRLISFTEAEFSGARVYFDGAEFSGRSISFVKAKFSDGYVSFDCAKFSGHSVSFGNARFSGGTVDFRSAKFSSGSVDFDRAEFTGSKVLFDLAEFSGATVGFDLAEFSGGAVSFDAEFSGGAVNFIGAEFSGGWVTFGARFSGGTVSFDGAEFSSSRVLFGTAEFSGGEVDFSRVDDWSLPPAFNWTDTPPPGVKLPQKEDQSPMHKRGPAHIE